VTVAGYVLSGTDKNNYVLIQPTGLTAEIYQRSITVTADDTSKTEGQPDPALTYSVTGSLVGSDAFSGALIRVAGETVGPYAITQGTLALSSNYALTYVPGTLTIAASSVIPPPSPPTFPPAQSTLAQLFLLAGWWNAGGFPGGFGQGPAPGPLAWGAPCKGSMQKCAGFPYPGNGGFSPFVTYH
jgi:hypothetical protein